MGVEGSEGGEVGVWSGHLEGCEGGRVFPGGDLIGGGAGGGA